MPTCLKCGYWDDTDAEFDKTRTICEGCIEIKFEFYDFFISIAYGYLGQFIEEGDEDALAYEVQFEVDEEQDRFVFKQFVTNPSHFNESDITEKMKRQLEDLVNERYIPSDDVSV